MKIVHVCCCGPMTDGWNYQENLLTKYHRQMGMDVTAIASKFVWSQQGKIVKLDQNEYINNDDVKMIRLDLYWGTNTNRLKVYKGLYPALERERADILFVHGVQFLDIQTIVRYLKKEKKKGNVIRVYVDNHVDFSNGASNWLSKEILHKILWKFMAKKIEPYTRKFYGVLPARVKFLEEMYGLPKEKCELLVMGADDRLVEAAAAETVVDSIRAKYGIDRKDFLIVTGGKIDAFKTQTLLLMEAVHRIESPNVKLLVFGSVSDELKERMYSLADGTKVQYVGWINAEQSYQYFSAADLVVFPGRHSVFWEQAAAQGKPMVCKEWDGTKHVDEGGNVVFLQEDSAEEIYRVINRISSNSEIYEQMKRIAEGSQKETFSYGSIARKAIEKE